MNLPLDYAERVYAGVLGKIIGVYLGRPFEQWNYRDILQKLGPINYYVHEKLNKPLIVTDDDITGTFTFIRALSDFPADGANISAEQIGRTWLNNIIENKTILWWGGLGLSTEHTAFKRLKDGVPAPRSGSMAINGQVVAEQIGSQIFIDGWAMVAPGQPDLAAELACKAASVSHDGEAIYGAQLLAAMEAQAFVERDLNMLLDVGLSFIPKDSIIARMVGELRNFREKQPDWQRAMTDVMEKSFGYDKFGGNCHIIPNHGLIILALLYGDDSFQKSLMIANTCGWDTDCNSGNVGCLLGIKNGLASINAQVDFRGPVADRLFLPTAEGGECVSDALREAYKVIEIGHRIAGKPFSPPKGSARFHFSLGGSVQGFQLDDPAAAELSNDDGRLAIRFRAAPTSPIRVATATFIPPTMTDPGGGYQLLASPTLTAGQRVSADLAAAPGTAATVNLFLRYYAENDEVRSLVGETCTLSPSASTSIDWVVPPTGGQPIFEIGVEISSSAAGTVYLDRLTWSGSPNVQLGSTSPTGQMWQRQWVEDVSHLNAWSRTDHSSQAMAIIQNNGRGIATHGSRDWRDYSVTAAVTPHLAKATGIAARVQGLRRYYALLLVDDAGRRRARLIKLLNTEQILAEAPFDWMWDSTHTYTLELTVIGPRIEAAIDGNNMFTLTDRDPSLASGGIGLIVEEGRVAYSPVQVAAK